ncbi:MAG TPA: Gfo/Idh/MocA family oxidoreductase [Sedimentisphaerales bacterium]|nr:Gfo/Idh/MocA family oxidoreductase [Sedimentisphaerales bacterium]
MKKVKIGLVGLGWMGSWHGRNVLANNNAELIAVADANQSGISAFFKANNFECKSFNDYSRFLESNIDAVIIATPNAMHAQMCIEAAKKGKHIFCEKPMALNLEDSKRVREAVHKAKVKYLIGYHRRFNPLYSYVKDIVNEGKMGKVFAVESDYIHHVPGDLPIWSWLAKEDVAGSLFHAGSGHNVDLIRYMCGDIVEAACFKDVYLPRKEKVETEDTALAIFRFKSGAIGKVCCCVGPVMPFNFTLRLFGTKGSAVNNRIWFDSIPRFDQSGHENDCIELPAQWIPDNEQGGISETWDKLMNHFIDMLVNNTPCINDVDSAYKTSAACFAALKSAQTKEIVKVED